MLTKSALIGQFVAAGDKLPEHETVAGCDGWTRLFPLPRMTTVFGAPIAEFPGCRTDMPALTAILRSLGIAHGLCRRGPWSYDWLRLDQ